MTSTEDPTSSSPSHPGREERFLALLIDGDNAMATLAGEMLEEASKWGTVIIRRVYGDWTSPSLQSWRSTMQEHALDPIQQFSNVAGKNATDSALIIDAMDILHRGIVRGFCIASSDSDYTRLAKRVREQGFFVMGIGRAATPAAFRNACEVFVSVENLLPVKETVRPRPSVSGVRPGRPEGATHAKPPKGGRMAPPSSASKKDPGEALPILGKAFDSVVADDGRADLGDLGKALWKLDPSFDSRTYGRSQLMGLLKMLPETFVIERSDEKGHSSVFVRFRSPVD
jgi:hypothetical protein